MTKTVEELTDLLEEAEHVLTNALLGMDGGMDDAFCHKGICSREQCGQCQRVDAVSAFLAKLKNLKGELS